MGEAMSRRIRGVFNAANFWAIVLYNVLSLNSLEFAKLVGRRLIFKGGSRQSQNKVSVHVSTCVVKHISGICTVFFCFRFPSVHAVGAAGDLLWCAAGEGTRAATSPAGRSRAREASGWKQRKS